MLLFPILLSLSTATLHALHHLCDCTTDEDLLVEDLSTMIGTGEQMQQLDGNCRLHVDDMVIRRVHVDTVTGGVTLNHRQVMTMAVLLACWASATGPGLVDDDAPLELALRIAEYLVDYCGLDVGQFLDNVMVNTQYQYLAGRRSPVWINTRGMEGLGLEPVRGSTAEGLLYRRWLLNWHRGLESEVQVGFWHSRLESMGGSSPEAVRLVQWRASGQAKWAHEPLDELCHHLHVSSLSGHHPGERVRILNAGSGPFTPLSTMDCGGLMVDIISTDPLGVHYAALYDVVDPPIYGRQYPSPWPSERVSMAFPVEYFSLVHMLNSLDHSFSPLVALYHLLHITKPGGTVLLRHAQNEGRQGDFRNGLHQWAFTVENGSFIIWNHNARVDVSVAEVTASLVPHPTSAVPETDTMYVWVDMVKL
ncbi:hypothetical protein FOL47_001290 [Perkinsus chesapeaki]|uniref:Uncharacterized protein n=1 Tax=Perkinsus chesapeaki TaxID=330153 RepID=A0A7J6N0U5_PERCH|nr:hypothetical protein FOL47_001290 [Perkinsus chesapeaki]